ncbi:MAG: M67 family metallopeptidase [Acidimicrobiia bacterium]
MTAVMPAPAPSQVSGGALHPDISAAIAQHTRFCAPLEACGLLAVDADKVPVLAYCLTNVDRSPHRRFTVDPAEHFRAMRHAEANGWTIGGSFHSHPGGKATPSSTDIAAAFDPTWWYVVAGPLPAPSVRVYRIVAGVATEAVPGSLTAAGWSAGVGR